MTIRAASIELCWQALGGEKAVAGQRWVLTTMQDHGEALISMLWRILGNEQDVCDAYQDTFLRLARCEGRPKPRSAKAFVFRSAANTAISMLRRRKTHDKACEAVAATTAIRQRQANCADDLDARQLRHRLREEISRLPDGLRNVVMLKDLAELPYSQVAWILGISVATARVYRCRAVRLLSLRMAAREGG